MTDSQIDALIEIFQQRMQKVVDEYLTRMGQQVREIGEIIPSAQTRLVQLKKLGANVEYIQREIAYAADASIKDIARIFEAIAKDNARFADAYFGFDNVNAKSIIGDIGNGGKLLAIAPDGISELLRQSVRAQFDVTAGEMANLSRTTVVSDLYKRIIDLGIQSAQAGVEDYKSAMRRALREAAAEGLRIKRPGREYDGPRVEYASGRTMRLDSAVRMNVLDGIRALNQANMDAIGNVFGADGVELSAHPMCAEDHLPYQGMQMSNAEFAELQDKLDRPIGMWNCRHIAYPILLGISKPAHSADELAEFKSNSTQKIEIEGAKKSRYEWTQEQRRVETAVRYQQDAVTLAKAAGDDVLVRDAKRKIRELDSYYDRISEAAGTPKRRERMGTYYGKSKR